MVWEVSVGKKAMASSCATDPVRRPVIVTFDCPGAVPLFDRTSTAGIGGAEVRAVTFARFLAQDPRFRVKFVIGAANHVRDDSGAAVEVCCETADTNRRSPTRGLATHASRLAAKAVASLTKRALGKPCYQMFYRRHKTDVLCCFGVTNRTASVVRTARQAGCKVIVFVTSDRTLQDVCRRGWNNRGLYGERGEWCRFSLQHADAVVVQKEAQQKALQHSLGIVPSLIRNPIDLDEKNDLPCEISGHVLWIGRADIDSKRADLLLEIARRSPQTAFVGIMNVHDRDLYQTLRRTCPANLRIIEHVPFDKVESYYRDASVLLNTSNAEGFPNSFLQAAKYGVPIVSLNVDPDSIIVRYSLGRYCRGRLENAVQAIDEISEAIDTRRNSRTRIQDYVHRYHNVHDRVRDLQSLIAQVLAGIDSGPVISSGGVSQRLLSASMNRSETCI